MRGFSPSLSKELRGSKARRQPDNRQRDRPLGHRHQFCQSEGGPGGSHKHRQGLQQDLPEEEEQDLPEEEEQDLPEEEEQDLPEEEEQDHPEEGDHNHRVDCNPRQDRHNPRQDHQASKLPLMEGGLWVNHQSSSPET
jgi:hypothetical protein